MERWEAPVPFRCSKSVKELYFEWNVMATPFFRLMVSYWLYKKNKVDFWFAPYTSSLVDFIRLIAGICFFNKNVIVAR